MNPLTQKIADALARDIRSATHKPDGTPRRFRLTHAAHVAGTLAYDHATRAADGDPQLWFTFTPEEADRAPMRVRLHHVYETSI